MQVSSHLLMVTTDAALLGWVFHLSLAQTFVVAWVLAGVAWRPSKGPMT